MEAAEKYKNQSIPLLQLHVLYQMQSCINGILLLISLVLLKKNLCLVGYTEFSVDGQCKGENSPEHILEPIYQENMDWIPSLCF